LKDLSEKSIRSAQNHYFSEDFSAEKEFQHFSEKVQFMDSISKKIIFRNLRGVFYNFLKEPGFFFRQENCKIISPFTP